MLGLEVIAADAADVFHHGIVSALLLDVVQLAAVQGLSVIFFFVQADYTSLVLIVVVVKQPVEELVIVFFVVKRLDEETATCLFHLVKKYISSGFAYLLEDNSAAQDDIDVGQKPANAQAKNHSPWVLRLWILPKTKRRLISLK